MNNKNRLWNNFKWKIILYIIWALFIGLIFSCKVVHPAEQFIYNSNQIHHVSIYSDTTVLNWSDLKVLQIDSLQSQYLELNTER